MGCRIEELVSIASDRDALVCTSIPDGLDDVFYETAREVFSLGWDELEVPHQLYENLEESDMTILKLALQFDQVSPYFIQLYDDNVVSGEWSERYVGRDQLLTGLELADSIKEDVAHAFALARVWHHAALTCYSSSEKQKIAVENMEFVIESFKQCEDKNLHTILGKWYGWMVNRYNWAKEKGL